MEEPEIATSELIKTGEDTTEMRDFVDKACHHMPFPIPPTIIVSWLRRPLVRWDHGFCSTLEHQVDERLPGVSPIRNHPRERQSLQQRRRGRAVVALPSGQAQAQRVPQAVDQDMDLRAEATATPSQRLLIRRAVFFSASGTRLGSDDRAIQAPVFHIRTLAKCASIRSHTP